MDDKTIDLEVLEPKKSKKERTNMSDKKVPSNIQFSYNGRDYILEFDLDSCKALDRNGFNIDDATKYPASQLPILFHGAFKKHHRYINRSLSDEILEEMGNKAELWEVLLQMYSKPLETIFGSDESESGKNVSWVAN